MNYLWLTILGFGLVVGAGSCLYFERKLIAFGQKRLGISFIGRHGWLHLPADVFKFWLKNTTKVQNLYQTSILTVLGALIAWTMLSALFLLSHIDEEVSYFGYSIIFYLAYVAVSTLHTVYIVTNLRSKYSTLAGLRFILLNVFFEVPFNVLFLSLYTVLGDYSFTNPTSSLSPSLFVALTPLAFIFIAFCLVESKRAPHDHTEAESELVGGHLIEFGGRTLLIFFICEYLHLYFCVFLLATFILGGPSSVNFLYLLT